MRNKLFIIAAVLATFIGITAFKSLQDEKPDFIMVVISGSDGSYAEMMSSEGYVDNFRIKGKTGKSGLEGRYILFEEILAKGYKLHSSTTHYISPTAAKGREVEYIFVKN